MNVASLELCKELYELSGWDGPELRSVGAYELTSDSYPAYDLGYLLRKLPTLNESQQYLLMEASPVGYAFGYAEYGELRGLTGTADTPEDAACKLAIELLKQGILTPTKETS